MLDVTLLLKIRIFRVVHDGNHMANLHVFQSRREIVFFLTVVVDAIELKLRFSQRLPGCQRFVQQG